MNIRKTHTSYDKRTRLQAEEDSITLVVVENKLTKKRRKYL
jgi:hypothetical protein